MSGIFVRNRNLSTFEFYNSAIQISKEVNRLVASETVVPKKRKFLNAVPAMEAARSLLYNINRSDSFYPSNARNAYERKKYLTLAIADCEQLCLDMQQIIDLNPPAKIARFERLAELINLEIDLLKKARKGVKVIGTASIEDEIRDHEDELRRLRELQ